MKYIGIILKIGYLETYGTTGIFHLVFIFEKYKLYLLLFSNPELGELKVRAKNEKYDAENNGRLLGYYYYYYCYYY